MNHNARRIRWYCGGFYKKDSFTYTVDHRKYLEVMNLFFRNGYTMYHATGMWMGQSELTYIFETLGDSAGLPDRFIQDIAKALRDAGGQEAVMVTSEDVNMVLV